MIHLNKIIIATGIYLKDNATCSPVNVQDMIIKHFDEIRIPLKKVEDGLEVLRLGGFLDKLGDLYRKSEATFCPLKEHKSLISDNQRTNLWSMEV